MRKTTGRPSVKSPKAASDPLMRLYLNEISKIPLLTVEEERELGRRIKHGDFPAQQKLIVSNLRFVIKIAKKFARRSDQLMEMINVGNVGLIEAARRFDPDMNVRFISYAIWWIRQAIFHHLAQSTHAFRVSPRLANLLYRVARIKNREQGDPNVVPDRERLSKEVGVSVMELEIALKAGSKAVSLDQPINEEGGLFLSDLLEGNNTFSAEEDAIRKSGRRALERSIGYLSPTQQKVIRLRFGLNDDSPLTLQEVGKMLNRSRERVRQIERDALMRLKKIYRTRALNDYLT